MPFNIADFKEPQLDQTVMREILLKGADEAPIIGSLLALPGGTREANSAKVWWYSEDFASERTQILNGGAAFTAATTALTVVSAAVFKAGDEVFLESSATGERVLVTAVDTATNTITVVRGFGGTTADIPGVANNAFLRFAGNISGEGSDAPASTSRAKGEFVNYMQHFKEVAAVSGKASRVLTRTDDEMAHQRMVKTRTLAISMDRSLIFGVRNNTALIGGKAAWSMDGLLKAIPLNDNVGGAMSFDRFNLWAADVFRYSQGRKLLFAGSTLNAAIHTLANNRLQTRTGEAAMGLRITEVVTNSGVFDLIRNPSLDAGFSGMGIAIDPTQASLRFLPGMLPHIVNNIEPDATDEVRDLVQAELTLQYGLPETHGIIRGVTAAA